MRNQLIIKNEKANYHVRNYSQDVFGLAEHQKNATYGLGFQSTLQRENFFQF